MTTQARYVFGDIAGCTAFLLEPNALTLQTTSYDTFETFSKSLIKALEILHTVLRLDFVERIGLRYLDAILPSTEGQNLSDFLVPAVLGHAMRGHGQLLHSISETMVMTSAGQLVSRVIVRNGQVGLPMELSGVALTIAPRFTQRHGLHAIIDTDASFIHRDQFELSKVEGRMTALHDEIVASFKATVTDQAWESWA